MKNSSSFVMNSFSVFLSRFFFVVFHLFFTFVRSHLQHRKICSVKKRFSKSSEMKYLCIYKRPLTEDDERNGLVWRSHYKTDSNRTLMN